MAEIMDVDTSTDESDLEIDVINSAEANLRSEIYGHFNEHGESKAQVCKYCRTNIKRDKSGSTGNLIRHFNKCRKKPKSDKLVQPKILDAMKKQTFVNDKFHKLIARHLILTNQAFQAVESPSFLEFQGYGRPLNATVPKADAMKKIIMQMYNDERAKIQDDLKDHNGKVSIVVDVWSSKNRYSFHGIIATWITKEWIFKEALLDLDILDKSHTGDNLAKSLWKVLEDFGITEQIASITSDNASNCDSMFQKLEQNFQNLGLNFSIENNRIRCLAHIANLACQDAIEILKKVGPKAVETTCSQDDVSNSSMQSEISSSDSDEDDVECLTGSQNGTSRLSIYHRLRYSISKIRNTGRYNRKFKKVCHTYELDRKMLKLDIKTRWNSTYHMLQRALELRKAVDETVEAFGSLTGFALSDEEWSLVKQIIDLLKPFEDVTNLISQGKTPQMSQTAAVYHFLYEKLEKAQKKQCQKNSDMRDACNAAIIKLNKYYPHSDGLIYILGLILDPRCKLQWYRVTKTNADVIKKNKKIAIDYWVKFYRPNTESEPPEESESDLIALQMKPARTETRDEFRQYLAESIVDPKSVKDILLWWKEHENIYPNLARMARDTLCASGTGVPIERTFSLGTDLLAPKRRALKDVTIRKCMSLNCWLRFGAASEYSDFKLKAIKEKFVGA